MSEFPVPWLLLAIALPGLAAIGLQPIKSAALAKQICLLTLGLSLFATLAEWFEFSRLQADAAHDRWDILAWLFGRPVLSVDRFSAPLLALNTLFAFLVVLATRRTKVGRVSFSQLLLGQMVTQWIFSSQEPWTLVVLSGINLLFPWLELRHRRRSARVFLLHALMLWLCLSGGYGLIEFGPATGPLPTLGHLALLLGILARCWTVPFHCGLIDLFDKLGFGTALLFSSALIGPYLAMRLGLRCLPAWGMNTLAAIALLTAIYSAAMALTQVDVRRVFCYLSLSHGSLILVGLETGNLAGIGAGLSLWLGSSVAVVGLGLTLRSIESRFGRLTLARHQGYYEHIPRLAGLFLVTGLALVGFPGTIGFVSLELLVDSVFSRHPLAGTILVLSAAFSSIAILRAYFRLFTGHRHQTTVSLRCSWSEQAAITVLILLLVGGSLIPQAFTESRLRAASQLLEMTSPSSPVPSPVSPEVH
jgi:NADH-quinone oxidoreductase subunit M